MHLVLHVRERATARQSSECARQKTGSFNSTTNTAADLTESLFMYLLFGCLSVLQGLGLLTRKIVTLGLRLSSICYNRKN